jgi:glyoxylase-like metal-dependent hydrolase (beta-lactamase superfamily II)
MAYSQNTDEGLIVPKKWWEKLPRAAWDIYEKVEQPDAWFEVYKLTNEVFALYEPGQFEEVISYLVIGENKAALIDTGNGIGDIKRVVCNLTKLPIIVINTHSHADHIGKNSDFDEIALMDTDFSKERAANGLTKCQMRHFLDEGMVWKPLPRYFDPEQYRVKPFKVTNWMKDGDSIDLGDRKLEIIHTPGHSPDSVCIIDKINRLFWTGDSFYPAPIYIYKPHTNLDQFIESFEKITGAMEYFDWVMPSHNEPKIEKHLLEECYDAAKSIKSGTAGQYKEGIADGIKVHRYDYERYSLIVRAPI